MSYNEPNIVSFANRDFMGGPPPDFYNHPPPQEYYMEEEPDYEEQQWMDSVSTSRLLNYNCIRLILLFIDKLKANSLFFAVI